MYPITKKATSKYRNGTSKYSIINYATKEVLVGMEARVEQYLSAHAISLQKISKTSGVALSTLSAALNKPIENWSVRILNAVSQTTGERPSEVLQQLQPENFELELDDEQLTIQGVQFDDEYTYANVLNAVLSNVYEGWQPTMQDVQRGKDLLTTPDPELAARYAEIFNEED